MSQNPFVTIRLGFCGRAFLLLLFVFPGLFISACSDRKSPTQTKNGEALQKTSTGSIFIRSELGELATLNPLVAEDQSSSGAIELILQGLTNYNWVKEEVEPGLAESWTLAPDGKTYTFKLRQGIVWSDGHPFTADDIVFSYNTYLDERFPNRSSFQLKIEGKPVEVRKIDDYTVELKSPKIYAPFLLFVGGTSIIPKHKLEGFVKDGSLLKQWSIATAKNTPAEIVGLGPYVLESYRPGERIVFKRNPHFYRRDADGNPLPYIERIISQIFRDNNSTAIAFAQGLTDAETLSPGDIAWVERSAFKHDFRIINRGPSSSTSFIWFNQNPGKNKDGKTYVDPVKLSWFTNQKFRQAVSYAVNRQGIVNGVLFGRGQPLDSSTSPANHKWYNPDTPKYPYDPGKARALLKEAGFSYDPKGRLRDAKGNLVSFSLETNKENEIRTDMATVFKENMDAIGISVELKFIDFNTLVVKISDSFEYESSLLGLGGGASDPEAGKDIYMSGGRLHQWYPSQKTPATPWEARIDELMVKQATTLDDKERKKLFDEVQYIMAEQQPFIMIVTPNAYVGVDNKWQNIRIPGMGSLFWNIEEIWTNRL
jgi:peptide/nickel transport system substrate-binding protein